MLNSVKFSITMATVTASINYTAPLELYTREKPFYSNVPAPDGRQSNQVAWKYDNVEFHDIRRHLGDFTLDKNGFEVFQYGEEPEDGTSRFDSTSWIEKHYYPVVEKVLRARFGDVDVKIFDHTVSDFALQLPCQTEHDTEGNLTGRFDNA